jgi:hypothetical protein
MVGISRAMMRRRLLKRRASGFGGTEMFSGFAGMPVGNVMCEKTVLKFKKK